ncbi:uncharacterized protein [Setaria viridis]|uniref:Wall-associated receptor kinase galacturonan-binding domain-containing protein n=1 Tax=Setaria viridis TaxID=4556 RepID=A0A4U6UHV9_SETVI|nr:hypothetical protein SEVIR_5G093000v2 [Setaria viridis]
MAPSSLLLFLVSSVPAMLAAGEEDCPTVSVACGKVNITFLFAIVPDEMTETSCGLIGFQVRCRNNNPYLGYNNRLYGHQFQILDIFYNNASFLLADVHKLQGFNNSASEKCHAPTNNSSNNLGLPFSISPNNQNLIFYNCTKPLLEEERWSRGLVETTCGNMTFVRVAGRSDGSGSYGSYFLEGCSSTVVPVLARYGHANASNYKELISDGFLLTWEAPLKSGIFHSSN